MKKWFKFKGIQSDSMHVAVVSYALEVVPSPNAKSVYLPGRNGSFYYHDSGRGDVFIRIKCAVLAPEGEIQLKERVSKITGWLLDEGDLMMYDEAGKSRTARLSHSVVFESMNKWGQFMLNFRCSPFLMGEIEEQYMSLSCLNNNGALPSFGCFKFTIGSQAIKKIEIRSFKEDYEDYMRIEALFQPGKKVELDMEKKVLLINNENYNHYLPMDCRFFSFPTGENYIEFNTWDEQGREGSIFPHYIYRPRWY